MSDGKKVERILARLLRPALKLCLRHSMKLTELLELIKRELVEIATEQLEHDGEKVSGSRIAVMTGVHRKDVARFQRAVPKEKPK
ncbi:MAG: hypothetical protein KDD62_03690, partial [Bdellovibrionales bacterium]|nr:hypothetical protein [Bdellovibrionales bacterium]